jgi:hypothetical protein
MRTRCRVFPTGRTPVTGGSPDPEPIPHDCLET